MAWEWTEQLENNVLEAIESGLTLRQVAKENGISAAAIIRHVQANEVFAKQYAHAMDIRTEADCDALVDVISEAPQTTKFGVDAGWVQWKRVQIDTVKWLLSKRNPKKYSDKVALTAADGGPVQIQFAAKSILEDGK